MTIREIYPDHINHEICDKMFAQCVIDGDWLLNKSTMDMWFEIDGFEIKVPAQARILCTGWNDVRRAVENMDSEEFYGCHGPVVRNGFRFTHGSERYILNRLVVFSPDTARHWSVIYGRPERTMEEHIALINTMNLDTITVVAEDLRFLPRCPGLKSVNIIHAAGVEKSLDYTPLYELSSLERLLIDSGSDGISKSPAVEIDFSRIPQLKQLSVHTNDLFNYHVLPHLEQLFHSNDRRHKDLTNISCSPVLKELELMCCSTNSLAGIEQYPLQSLSLSYLRSLEDISELAGCAPTLRSLSIDACGKIRDFSCLNALTNLEYLHLNGSNTLPDLQFINRMPKLKAFVFSMTIADGDLSPCLRLPYAACSRGKRHYNLKDHDLPKTLPAEPFTLI